MIGMIIGSVAGGYLPGLLGADGFSLTSLLGSGAGGILGIWGNRGRSCRTCLRLNIQYEERLKK